MKQIKHLKLLIVLSTVLFVQNVHAQVKYGINFEVGKSRVYYLDNDPNCDEGYANEHFAYSYSADGFVREYLKNPKISFEQGLKFVTTAVADSLSGPLSPDLHMGSLKEWEIRLYSLSVPLRINYHYIRWFNIKAGVETVFHLADDGIYSFRFTRKNIALRAVIGAEATIAKRILTGLNFYYSLTSDYKTTNYDIGAHTYVISLKLGVLLSK
jgi:hypothetical protein